LRGGAPGRQQQGGLRMRVVDSEAETGGGTGGSGGSGGSGANGAGADDSSNADVDPVDLEPMDGIDMTARVYAANAAAGSGDEGGTAD
jgi:hypothetical protein